MSSAATPIELTSFLWDSTPHLLAYALPLLLLSILLTLSGTFLTLDRTRTFAPPSGAGSSIPGAYVRSKEKNSFVGAFLALRWARLDGGVGGAAAGYVFGLQLATFLTLLISNNTSLHSLTSTTFLVIWALAVIFATILGGRWKPLALLFIGLSGGISLSLGLSVLTHPSLPARVVLASVLTALVTVLVLLPVVVQPLQNHFQHAMTRFSMSCLGAFSATMTIAILTRDSSSSSWANAWDRLWVANGVGWESSRERGLDVLFCVLWAVGATCDWALNRWIGQDPDEKWDSYLADYTTTLPNLNDRAGNFQPLKSWWSRLLNRLHVSKGVAAEGVAPLDIIFPSDAELARKVSYDPVAEGFLSDDEKRRDALYMSKGELQSNLTPLAYNWTSEAKGRLSGGALLKKVRTKRRNGRGFTPVYYSDADDEGRVYGDDLKDVDHYFAKRKTSPVGSKTARKPVQFKRHSGYLTSSDEAESDNDSLSTPAGTPMNGIRIRASPMRTDLMSGTTMVLSATPSRESNNNIIDVEKELTRLAGLRTSLASLKGDVYRSRSPGTPAGAPEYSDVEEVDVTNALDRFPQQLTVTNAKQENWKPTFLRRASEHQHMPRGAVPMTPSLVNALDRIAVAQANAYGPELNAPGLARAEHVAIPMEAQLNDIPTQNIPGLPIVKDHQPFVATRDNPVMARDFSEQNTAGIVEPVWNSFWQEVLVKANGPLQDAS